MMKAKDNNILLAPKASEASIWGHFIMVRRGPHVLLLIDVHWQANNNFVSSCVFFSCHYYQHAREAHRPRRHGLYNVKQVYQLRGIYAVIYLSFMKSKTHSRSTKASLNGILFYFYISVIDMCFDGFIFVL